MQSLWHDLEPIHFAISFHNGWMRFAYVCQGILGGLGLFHFVTTLNLDYWLNPDQYKDHMSTFNEFYSYCFYMLITISLVSIFDSFDLGHLDLIHMHNLWNNRASLMILFMYVTALLLHLNEGPMLTAEQYWDYYESEKIISQELMAKFLYICSWHDLIVFLSWVFLATILNEDRLSTHLTNILQEMRKKRAYTYT